MKKIKKLLAGANAQDAAAVVTSIKTLKLEINETQEVYAMYEKPETDKYVVSVYAKLKCNGDLIHQFGLELPQAVGMGIRTDTDEHFEEDMIKLVLDNVANGKFVWKDPFEEFTDFLETLT